MKKLVMVLLLGLPMVAAASNCEEISASIAEKIKNNGVDENSFQLNLVPSEQAEQGVAGKIVGSCDRGQQKIVYIRSQDNSVTTEAKQQEPSNSNQQAEKAELEKSSQQEIVAPSLEDNQQIDSKTE
ncbi:DUF1161 domain-containing protein [Gilliamella apis]|uniref:DUF1161 domain-containing protein n=1 Tax=Gilliamella apis TaxID=1970738 RepID=A0A2V4DRE5_9GAMM|nr:DUF1161 domain-containing protein [Gilliamella apis]PXY90619.1 hypothetical protein DKK78_07560 [Gilliamella apis]WLS95188.1 DUF1161 domain-containing protein [Gilliamella apis]